MTETPLDRPENSAYLVTMVEPRAPFLDVDRSVTGRLWADRLDPATTRIAQAISQRTQLSEILARILAARGVGIEAAEQFLAPTIRDLMPDPSSLTDMDALADRLEGRMQIDPRLVADVKRARAEAASLVDGTLGQYSKLKNTLGEVVGKNLWWVRDITLSNSMWGNRAPVLDHPRAGVHALGGGIGQGLAMGVGVAVANAEHQLGRKTLSLCGDGGFMLNVGELACAAQEKADVLFIVMNDSRYGVIKNIQDAVYGSRHCYVELHNPDFAQFCASLQVAHHKLSDPALTDAVLQQALQTPGPVVVEVDMAAWGAFPVKFAGPPKKTD